LPELQNCALAEKLTAPAGWGASVWEGIKTGCYSFLDNAFSFWQRSKTEKKEAIFAVKNKLQTLEFLVEIGYCLYIHYFTQEKKRGGPMEHMTASP
jgi:hypothetical protein